jgi:hypothetical protein
MKYKEIVSETSSDNASDDLNKIVDANHKKSVAAQRYQVAARSAADQKRLIAATGAKNASDRQKAQDGKLARAKGAYQNTLRSANKTITDALGGD